MNALGLRIDQFLNLTYTWITSRLKKEDKEEFDALLIQADDKFSAAMGTPADTSADAENFAAFLGAVNQR